MNKSLEERVAYLEAKIDKLEKQLQQKTTATHLQGEPLQSKESQPSGQIYAEEKAQPEEAISTKLNHTKVTQPTHTAKATQTEQNMTHESVDTTSSPYKPTHESAHTTSSPHKSSHDAADSTFATQKAIQEPHDSTTRPNKKIRPGKKSQPVSEPIQWDIFIFQKLLPRVFIFIFILGIVWGLKASYDYGLITIQIILTLSIALSIIMAGLGVFQIKKDRRVLGQVLIGGAIPIFILTIFAMHQMYDMIGPTSAMLLNIIAVIAGIIFAYTFRSESIGVISVIAGVLVPYLIETTEPNYYVFVTYEAALYLLFLSLALYMNFRVLYFVATFFLHIAILGIHTATLVPKKFALLTVMPVVFQQVALFGGLLLTKIKLKTQAYTLLVSLLLTSLWLGFAAEKFEATAIYIGLAIMYAVGFYFFKQDSSRAPIFMINATLATLFIFVVQEFEIAYEILLVTTLMYLFYAQRFKALLHYIIAGIQYIIAFSLFTSSYIDTWISYELMHQVAFLIVTIVGLYMINRQDDSAMTKQIGLPYVALLLMFFSTDLTYLISNQHDSFDSMPLILSSFWVVIAIGYMIFSKITKITIGSYIGAAILFFTVAKVVLFDISFMSMTFRAILFTGLGLIGLIISRLYNKGAENQE